MFLKMFTGAIYACIAFISFNVQAANLITNGDFETGDFLGWTQFTETNGVIGSPVVSPFDINGDGTETNSANNFKVGQAVTETGVFIGGGIYQQFTTSIDGAYSASLDISSYGSPKNGNGNGEGGLFSLQIDGESVNSFQFGFIDPGGPYIRLYLRILT